jgi:hypothetical protein
LASYAICHLPSAIAVRRDTGGGVNAQVRVNIDKPWCNPFARRIDDSGVWDDGSCSDPFDSPIADMQARIVELLTVSS